MTHGCEPTCSGVWSQPGHICHRAARSAHDDWLPTRSGAHDCHAATRTLLPPGIAVMHDMQLGPKVPGGVQSGPQGVPALLTTERRRVRRMQARQAPQGSQGRRALLGSRSQGQQARLGRPARLARCAHRPGPSRRGTIGRPPLILLHSLVAGHSAQVRRPTWL